VFILDILSKGPKDLASSDVKGVTISISTYISAFPSPMSASYPAFSVQKITTTTTMAFGRTLLLCFIFSYCTLSVTVIPLTLSLPEPYDSNAKPITSVRDQLLKLQPGMGNQTIFFSSYNGQTPGTYASQDSFVRGAIDAGAKHQHFVIRPQDVWLTILKQFASYMRKHKSDKEALGKWDYLDGTANLPLHWSGMNHVDSWMEMQFKRRNRTDWLMDWVRPGFPTVLHKGVGLQKSAEEMIANAVMMSHSTPTTPWENVEPFPCRNGIPSITLLGAQIEWKELLGKLEPMEKGQFGTEPGLYARNLRPILSRFVTTFVTPNDPVIRLFWNDIITMTARQPLCHTTDIVTGWINAFHFWNGAGDTLLPARAASNETLQIDTLIIPGRKINDLPTTETYTSMCFGDQKGGQALAVLVGMLGKSIKKGMPQDYLKALQMVGLTLPPTVVENDHSMLLPEPAWIAYTDGNVRIPQYNSFLKRDRGRN
jgi:hypothetical protein